MQWVYRHTYTPLPSRLRGQHLCRSQVAALCWPHCLCFSSQQGSWASLDTATTPPTSALAQGLVQLHCCKDIVTCLSNFSSEFDFQHPLTDPYYTFLIRLNHPLTFTIFFSEDIDAQDSSSRVKETPYHFSQTVAGLCSLFCLTEKPNASGSESAHYFSFPTIEVQEICAEKYFKKLFLSQYLPLCLSISFIWKLNTFSPLLPVISSINFPEQDKLQFSNENTRLTCM